MQLLRQTVRRGVGALTLLGALAACDSTEPSTPSALQPVGSVALAGRAGQPAPQPVTVQVLNSKGNPLSNQTVTFSVTAGGGSVSPATAQTDANGQASTTWTFGRTVGVQSLSAQVTGLTTTVQFLATVTAGAPAAVAVSAGDNQTAPVGTTVAARPAVVVRDAGGNPVPGVEVSFTVSQGNGTVTGGTATTDANGVAAVGSWQLGTTAGRNQLTATVLGAGITGNPVVFTATGTAGLPARIEAQPLASATSTAGVAVPANNLPSVIVRDANGNPVQGATVTFSVLGGGGSVSGATVQTNASGVATVGGVTLGPTAGLNTIAATGSGVGQVTFAITGVAGAPSTSSIVTTTNNQRVQAGNPLPVGPSILVVDRFGNPVPGVQVTFSVGTGGGSVIGPNGQAAQSATATTNANGVATVSGFTLGPNPGTNTLIERVSGLPDVTLTAVGLPGAPATLTRVSAESLSVVSFRTVPLTVEVRDARGNVIPDQPVTFAVASGTGGTVSSPVTTDANGRATATFTGSSSTGVVTVVNATVGGLSVSFAITTTPNVPARAEIVQGQTQTATAGGPVPVVPIVRIVDAQGNPVAGVTVNFQTFRDANGNPLSTVTNPTVVTDANGQANPGAWILGTEPGVYQLSVLPAGTAPLLFTATAVPVPVGIQVTANSAQSQAGNANTAVASPPSVLVRNASGSPLAGITVEFRVSTGGTISGGGLANAQVVYVATNSLGIATLTNWVLGSEAATTYTVVATVVSSGQQVVFTATTQ